MAGCTLPSKRRKLSPIICGDDLPILDYHGSKPVRSSLLRWVNATLLGAAGGFAIGVVLRDAVPRVVIGKIQIPIYATSLDDPIYLWLRLTAAFALAGALIGFCSAALSWSRGSRGIFFWAVILTTISAGGTIIGICAARAYVDLMIQQITAFQRELPGLSPALSMDQFPICAGPLSGACAVLLAAGVVATCRVLRKRN